MSTPPPLDETQPYMPPDGDQEKPKNGWMRGCLIGCLAVGAISTLICAGVGYYIYKNGPRIAIQSARQALTSVLAESNLPEEERQAIMGQFDRVGDGYLEGELTMLELGSMGEDLLESPMLSALFISVVEMAHLEESGLSEEEKTAGRDALKRIVNGAMTDMLDPAELDSIMNHLRQNPNATNPAEKIAIKERFSDQELRALIADAQEICADKEIPLEGVEIKISEKMKAIIDKYLEN